MVDLTTLLQSGTSAHRALERLSHVEVYPRSIAETQGVVFFMGRTCARGHCKRVLGALMEEPERDLDLRVHPVALGDRWLLLGLGELTHTNATMLRRRLPFATPACVGVRKSVGLGDRLGIATPGHIQALRQVNGIVPILAQQSIREMQRTMRSPENVLDDATWGVLQEGWRAGYGADADHLKTEADIDLCAAAGFRTYTLDPGDYVDNAADVEGVALLRTKYQALPWNSLECTSDEARRHYLGRSWRLGGEVTLVLDEERLLRAACKYGYAVAHLARLARHLADVMGDQPYELEISVDETETPTRPEEHLFVASELRRLGVQWVSLAPRYVGRFEKGVDYIGNVGAFEASFRSHVAVARALGPYKLSLHSGSDKFSIYPLVAHLAADLVHLKTAGTSYLEALRAIARVDPTLFREIYAFASQHYEEDRVSYRVSAELDSIPSLGLLADSELAGMLDGSCARQALHVTFGSVLTVCDEGGRSLFRQRMLDTLAEHESTHYELLSAHIGRHLLPFADEPACDPEDGLHSSAHGVGRDGGIGRHWERGLPSGDG
ncbi:MAG: hypothetical protein FJZ90_11615 [Chloroflexi bacterium]|nr:hypothetical protein [Chloroflexota bacterium]